MAFLAFKSAFHVGAENESKWVPKGKTPDGGPSLSSFKASTWAAARSVTWM